MLDVNLENPACNGINKTVYSSHRKGWSRQILALAAKWPQRRRGWISGCPRCGSGRPPQSQSSCLRPTEKGKGLSHVAISLNTEEEVYKAVKYPLLSELGNEYTQIHVQMNPTKIF